MRKNCSLALGLLLVALGTVCGPTGLTVRSHATSGRAPLAAKVVLPQKTPMEANFERVRVGMTPEEVDAVLGPWSSEAGSHAYVGGFGVRSIWSREYVEKGRLIVWVTVNFHDGRVTDKELCVRPARR
jgi:hypothetical protein